MTRGEQTRFLKDLLALCKTYGVELTTCGCDDGLKATDDGTMAAKTKRPCLYGITVKNVKVSAHTDYYDGEEIVIDAEGNASYRKYE